MTKTQEAKRQLSEDELDADARELPDREAMSVLNLGTPEPVVGPIGPPVDSIPEVPEAPTE